MRIIRFCPETELSCMMFCVVILLSFEFSCNIQDVSHDDFTVTKRSYDSGEKRWDSLFQPVHFNLSITLLDYFDNIK